MKKIIRLTEKDLTKIVKRAVTEASRKLVKDALIDEAHCTGSGSGENEGYGHCY